MNFLASPEIVTAMAFSGELSFNPMRDSLIGADGKPFKFEPPSGSMLPADGFTPGTVYQTYHLHADSPANLYIFQPRSISSCLQ